MNPVDGPITAEDIGPLFDATFERAASIGVAVSGGADSTGLLVLLRRWAAARAPGPRLVVLTVDHGLRPESPGEAEAVVGLARRLGLEAHILTWRHEGRPPRSNLQTAAREARYALLAAAAKDLGLDAVALGHTLDDKAETFLIRMSRGSGLSGLAAMAAERTVEGMRFVRPLLSLSHERLVATLRAEGVDWIEDPSNAAERFLRVRIRRLMPELAAVGLTADRIAGTADRLSQASTVIDAVADALAAEALEDHGGVVSVHIAPVADAGDEVALRLLARAFRAVRPSTYPPRAEALEQILADLRKGGDKDLRRRTAGGVVADPRRDRLWLYAEAGRTGFPVLTVDKAGTQLWDGRFWVDAKTTPTWPLIVGAATGAERRSDVPSRAAASLPVLRDPVAGTFASEMSGVTLRRAVQV